MWFYLLIYIFIHYESIGCNATGIGLFRSLWSEQVKHISSGCQDTYRSRKTFIVRGILRQKRIGVSEGWARMNVVLLLSIPHDPWLQWVRCSCQDNIYQILSGYLNLRPHGRGPSNAKCSSIWLVSELCFLVLCFNQDVRMIFDRLSIEKMNTNF